MFEPSRSRRFGDTSSLWRRVLVGIEGWLRQPIGVQNDIVRVAGAGA